MSVRSPKVLFLVTEDWYFWSHRLPLALAAMDAGYRVAVATRVREHGDRIMEAGCDLLPLRWRRRGGLFSQLRAVHEVVECYRAWRPDIVHHVALKPVVLGSMAARLAGVSHVVNAIAGFGYVFASDSRRAKMLRPILRGALRLSLTGEHTRIIVQNPDDREVLLHERLVRADRVVLIRGSGVDLQAFVPTPFAPGPVVVLFAGRMLWEKGVGEFVQAAGKLQAEHTTTRFVLVGAPDPDNPNSVSEDTLREWHAQGMIEWWGPHTDMPVVMSRSHIVCLPSSYGEGIPKVLLEAAAAGRPIVTTDAPGCREIVRNQENGILVPPRDVEALAQALGGLIRDDGLRQRYGAAGRMLVEEGFGVQDVVQQTLAVYQELLA